MNEGREIAATRECGCHIYRDELPLERWECPHGFIIPQPRRPPPPDGIIAIG